MPPEILKDRYAQYTSDQHSLLNGRYLQIKQERPTLARRRLRLIHAGRLLSDGSYLFQILQPHEQRKSRAIDDKDEGTHGTPTVPFPIWLHCSVGAEMTGTEAEAEDLKTQVRC